MSGQPLRVVFLTADLARAGAERQVVEIATRLRARGMRTQVVSLFTPRAYVDELREAGVPVSTADMRHDRRRPSDITRAASLLRAVPADVLVSFTFPANIVGRLLGRASAPRIVTSLRSTRFGSALRDRLLAWTDRLTWINVVNSTLVKDELVARGVIDAGRVRVIPNGLDLEAWDAAMGSPAHNCSQEFTWLAVGRLEKAKDYPTLIRACALLRDRGHRFRLRIVGEGQLHGDLVAGIGAHGLAGIVTLEGLRTDVPRCMARADAFVLSSEWEGSPNALMEAMASSLPFVATDVGGVRELAGPAHAGVIVGAGDPQALAGAMESTMAHDAATRARIGTEARTRIEANHGFHVVIPAWETLLREAVRTL